jgi:hypothetical protein
MSDESFQPLIRGFSLPVLDEVSGILKHKDLNLQLTPGCELKYRNLRASGPAIYLSKQAECGAALMYSACTAPEQDQIDPAAHARQELFRIQRVGLDIRAALDELTPESVTTTQTKVCTLLDAINETAFSKDYPMTSPDIGVSPQLHSTLVERVAALEDVFGAQLRRASADIAILSRRVSSLEADNAGHEYFLERFAYGDKATKVCRDHLRMRLSEIQAARLAFDTKLNELGIVVPATTSLFSSHRASIFFTKTFEPCKADPTPETRRLLGNVTSKLTEALDAARTRAFPEPSTRNEQSSRTAMVEIDVIGYADQKPLIDRAQCGPHTSNYDLALERAKTLASLIPHFIGSRVRVLVTAIGEDRVLNRDCNWEGGREECHAKNRRLEIRMRIPSLSVDLATVCRDDAAR